MLQEIITEVVKKGKPRQEHSPADPKLNYLARQEFFGQVLIVSEDEEKGSALEKEADDSVKIGTEDDNMPALVRYLRFDENMMPHLAGDEIDSKDWYGRRSLMPEEEEYQPPRPISGDDDDSSYKSLTEEVHEEIKDLKYDFLNQQEIDTRKIKLLALYMALNPAEFAFYEYILSLNRDSVY